jgi:hypothetical protein
MISGRAAQMLRVWFQAIPHEYLLQRSTSSAMPGRIHGIKKDGFEIRSEA